MEMESRVLLLLFTLCCLLAADETEPLGEISSAAAPGEEQQHMQRAVKINACLNYVPDVGCDTFACLENTSCALHNLYELCRNFLQNAGNFDVQGKQFIKDLLKCSATGIKSSFSCSVTRCAAMQGILSNVQAKCYQEHNICAAANSNVDAFVKMIDIKEMLLNRAYLEYVKVLFDCGNKITDAIRSCLQSRLGSPFSILRQLLQDSCIRTEKTTPPSTSEGIDPRDDNMTHDHYWK